MKTGFRLDGFELEIFKLVRELATSEQWREWLRAPLEHVAAKGSMDVFTRLVDAGADGSAGWRGCHGRTLLGAAGAIKDDLNAQFGAKRESALHVATVQGAEHVSKALLLNGYMESPLHLATEAGYRRS